MFMQLATLGDFGFEFTLEPSEGSVMNNRTVLHAPTEFDKHPEKDPERFLLRLWLTCEGWWR